MLVNEAISEFLAYLLVELNRDERVTLIVATHSAALAARMRHRFELRNGKLVAL